ncbi:ImmA/IrrE family metallo-endopeptidase [Leuconostoc falkenbergense]|uniref:ImmA/IrrE family metallo-endopeptidase n=1 Tax=Leuconostoc falkenbergense TaxID=2766470 RepID=UPI0021AAFE7A|nr:ImmA/IrrE family metallo-endopeptidase [Leuconostoc falkenbergense]MCT4410287.1 ImmA/IrrE family metallo-endopeptidase [Leuconostoc falkenbergense]
MIDVISDEVISKLLTIADSHNIIIRDNLNLTTGTPDVCFTYDKGIVMNPNWDIKVNYSFRLSHELSHILYGDHEAQAVYQFSEYGKRGEELLAHRNAIRMLMSIEMPTTVNGFMEYYHVPSWLENYANETFKSLRVVE